MQLTILDVYALYISVVLDVYALYIKNNADGYRQAIMAKGQEIHTSEADAGSNNDSDTYCDEPGPSSPKWPRTAAVKGTAVYRTKFNKGWTDTWPFIREVPGNQYSFSCTICKRQISCKHQWKSDIERHIGKRIHQANIKANVKTTRTQAQLPFHPMSSPRYMHGVACPRIE